MDTAIYATIWIALVCFCAAETGRRRGAGGRPQISWAWQVYVAGAIVCAIHIVLAMGATHGWSHEAAVAATARQTESVYGLRWGGGVYVNYAFVAIWIFEAWRWRRRPDDRRHPDGITWAARAFFLAIIANAAVIFASPARRPAGALIVIWLLWIWRPRFRRPSALENLPDGIGE